MERKQRLALIFATVGVALGAGQLVQTSASNNAALVAAPAVPTQIEQVSAGPETPAKPPVIAAAVETPSVSADPVPAPVIAGMSPAAMQPKEPEAPPTVLADIGPTATPPLPALLQSPQTTLEGPVDPQIITAPAITAVPDVTPSAPVLAPAVANACAPSLRLAAAPQAMIGVSIVAPCAPEARVVIAHEGLVIAGKTNAQGTLFLSVPALAVDASVTARLPEGTEVMQSVRVPAMATLRRMGVQWHDADAFQLHAFENGAGYNEPGHVSAEKPQMPTTGLTGSGGFITVLGDPSVELPMMAEIYTFPAGIAANADITIEAAVTEATCGRELLGETIMTLAGDVYITDLSLAMPDCEAVGDILVLKNLLTDLTIAAAN